MTLKIDRVPDSPKDQVCTKFGQNPLKDVDSRVFTRMLNNSNMTSFLRFVNKRASYPLCIISLAHAPVNVTDFSIGSIHCNPNNADRGRSIIRVT